MKISRKFFSLATITTVLLATAACGAFNTAPQQQTTSDAPPASSAPSNEPEATETADTPATVPTSGIDESSLPATCPDFLGTFATKMLVDVPPIDDDNPGAIGGPGLSPRNSCHWFGGDVTGVDINLYIGDLSAATNYREKIPVSDDLECEVDNDGWLCSVTYETKYQDYPIENFWGLRYQDGCLLEVRVSNLNGHAMWESIEETVFG